MKTTSILQPGTGLIRKLSPKIKAHCSAEVLVFHHLRGALAKFWSIIIDNTSNQSPRSQQTVANGSNVSHNLQALRKKRKKKKKDEKDSIGT